MKQLTNELDLRFGPAKREHLVQIVELLADDKLGVNREAAGQVIDARYLTAFKAIDSDPNNELIVAEQSGSVVGTLQITYAANLTHMGAMRATIEGVRVSSSFRRQSVGKRMLSWTIDRCASRGCRLIQLTSDLARDEAIDFYRGLGFKHTHAGLKLWL